MICDVIGIYLGTSYSVASVYKDGIPTLIPSSESSSNIDYFFPNYVAFTDESILVGESARKRFISYPNEVFRLNDSELGTTIKKEYNGKNYSQEELLAFILGNIKKEAEIFLNKTLKRTVITAPAYFYVNQRNSIRDAAKIAGFNVVTIVNEPTAACLAYDINNQFDFQRILIFDLGNSTLNVSIIEYYDENFKIKATSGDSNFGSIDIDNLIVNYLAKEFEKQHHVKLNLNRRLQNSLFETAKKVRINLSNSNEIEIFLPFMSLDSNANPLDLVTVMTRFQFDDLIRPVLNSFTNPIQMALDGAGFTKKDINKLLLVGEATRIPIVRDYVQNVIGITAESGIDPSYCYAIGAAVKGAILSGYETNIEMVEIEPVEPVIEDDKEILRNQINELDEILYFAKKYLYEPEFEEKINKLDLNKINELIHILKEEYEI